MKRLSVFATSGLILAALLFSFPVPARADSFTQTFFRVTETFTDFVPCTNVKASITITYNGVVHFNTDGSGGSHFTLTQTGDFTAVAKKVTWVGHFTIWPGANSNSGGTFVFTATFSGHGEGSDGSTIQWAAVTHVTVNPDGTTTSAFDEFRCL